MTGWNRREMLHATGAVVAGTLLAPMAGAVGTTPPAAEALAHVAPELRPAAQRMLTLAAQSDPFTDVALPKLRAAGAAGAPAQLADVPVTARQVPVGRGQPDVTVYVVNAKPGGAARPAILHTHGGGFILGSAKQELAYLQQLARDVDCVIVTVEYRLAPETRYSGSIEENYAGLRWLHAHAATLGVDRTRIAVMGESAGGGHAALLAIVARNRGEVPVAFQSLIYPMLDDRTGGAVQLPSFIGAVVWTGTANQYGWRSFLGMSPGTARVPAAAVPVRVADLRGLPPTFIAVGGVDLFAPEDMTYARRLVESGVATECLLVPGAFHAFDRIAPDTPQAQQFTRAKLAALRRAFAAT
ncbi:alpha/beta hydrolase [Sphingomonas faeni]|uniref:alpha/beta hydrolase n=1 Tax=Sphingomonas faeni TaxID=185950 RepID=UPI003353F51B